MILRHDLQTDCYRYEDENCATQWHMNLSDAKKEYEAIRERPEVELVQRSAFDYMN